MLAIFIAAGAMADTSLWVGVNEFTGSSGAEKYIGLYENGVRTQKVFSPQTEVGTYQVRDLIQIDVGHVAVFNGTFTPTLWNYSLDPHETSSLTGFTEWSSTNVTYRGGLAKMGNMLYLSDEMTYNGGEAYGIIQYDQTAGTAIRFATDFQSMDLAVSGNYIYGMDGNGKVNKYDPSLNLVSTVTLPNVGNYMGLGVGVEGDLYVSFSTWLNGNKEIQKFSPAGTLVKSLIVPNVGGMGDIDIDTLTGAIAVGTTNSGMVVITDTNLDSYSSFRATDSESGGSTFVAFAQNVPEPGSATLILLAGGLFAGRRRRSR